MRRKETVAASIDDAYMNRNMSFEDIHRMNFAQLMDPRNKKEKFQMQEFLDLDLEDDETSPKFRRKQFSPKRRNLAAGYPLTEKRTAKSVVKKMKMEMELS